MAFDAPWLCGVDQPGHGARARGLSHRSGLQHFTARRVLRQWRGNCVPALQFDLERRGGDARRRP